MSKRGMREIYAAIRDRMSVSDRERADRRIEAHLFGWEAFSSSRYLFCYVSFRSEVGTIGVIGRALAGGKTVCVPRVNLKTGLMRAYILADPSLDLVPGSYGILEPKDGCPEADYDSIDLVIAPGLAFSLTGDRLGYGGGYYDRFLHAHAGATVCALAYDALIVDTLPVKEHDRSVDYVITESGVKKTSKGPA